MAATPSAAGGTSQPFRTADLIETIGVNTHLPYTDGSYADVAQVISDLKYLGVIYVRDGISDGANGSAPLSTYLALAQAGVKFTIDIGFPSVRADLESTIGLIDRLAAAVPGSVTAVEGANEIDNFAVTYNGISGLQGAIDVQQDLYSIVHSDPTLAGVAVDYFTGYDAGSIPTGPNPGTTPGLADFDNQHPYPAFGEAPSGFVNPNNALSNETSSIGAAVYTETGYSTNGGTAGAVNADVQAKYTLDLLLDDALNGVSKTYLYPQPSPHFGLANPAVNTPAPDTASANCSMSGASLCSGMLGMSS